MTTTLSQHQKTLINHIAPLLRALLAEGEALKVVSFTPCDASADALLFNAFADESSESLLHRLSIAISDYKTAKSVLPRNISVKDLGQFIIKDPPASNGRAKGKIALVTGAAQGFGLEIACDFAKEGGVVALADLNEKGAVQSADEICAQLGTGRALGLSINVADGASVENTVHNVIRAFGGFDVLIANAGVLKAGSVKTQSEKEFEFVTNVNYKGYFNCVQKAAPVLALQRLAKPDYTSDIIQINSKSGLVGSNKNGAYAGSKFGGVGLTQSFALELIEDGVKVNSICPGNFFDGPLWSDPQTGLFVQYLNTGKVPGAKTLADVKKFYESKVPMGRGCVTADVMKAVYYLIDQQYETGQALPVTGGQVMLH